MGFLEEVSWIVCFCIGVFAELLGIFFMSAAGRFTAPLKGLVMSTVPMRNLENFAVVFAATSAYLIIWNLHYGWAFLGSLGLALIFGLAMRLVGVNPIPAKIASETPKTLRTVLCIGFAVILGYPGFPFIAIGFDKLAANIDGSEKVAIAVASAFVFVWALFFHKYLIEHFMSKTEV